jgi:hypothetical protein
VQWHAKRIVSNKEPNHDNDPETGASARSASRGVPDDDGSIRLS